MTTFTKIVTETVDCPLCGEPRVIKYGKSRKGVQRYQCRACERVFSNDGKAIRRRVPAAQVGAALSMYFDGLSYKRISENIADMFDIPEPSKATIFEWVSDYTELAKQEMGNHKARTGPEWVADEMVLKVGGKKLWHWNVMDSDTRYVLASYLSPNRDETAAVEVMRRAKNAAANLPKRIKSDKLKSYAGAIDWVFGGEVQHVQSEGLAAEINNNLSERLQGTFRHRSKVLRGLQTQRTGQQFLDGFVIDYNLFRPHEGLKGKTPGEVARVRAPFREWEDFAKLDASKFARQRRVLEETRKRNRTTRDKSFKVRKGSF